MSTTAKLRPLPATKPSRRWTNATVNGTLAATATRSNHAFKNVSQVNLHINDASTRNSHIFLMFLGIGWLSILVCLFCVVFVCCLYFKLSKSTVVTPSNVNLKQPPSPMPSMASEYHSNDCNDPPVNESLPKQRGRSSERTLVPQESRGTSKTRKRKALRKKKSHSKHGNSKRRSNTVSQRGGRGGDKQLKKLAYLGNSSDMIIHTPLKAKMTSKVQKRAEPSFK